MEECLAIKPDLVFLWDEAWFAFARFHPVYRTRTAMACRPQRSPSGCGLPDYKRRVTSAPGRRIGPVDAADDEVLLDRRLVPDPARARVRVYATQSTHKTLTSLRQGSMIHVYDQDFDQKVADTFHEAYMAHTSTSPNYQILASLDLGRRQVALEGSNWCNGRSRTRCSCATRSTTIPLLSKYMRCLRTVGPDPGPITGRPASTSRCARACAT